MRNKSDRGSDFAIGTELELDSWKLREKKRTNERMTSVHWKRIMQKFIVASFLNNFFLAFSLQSVFPTLDLRTYDTQSCS